MKISKQGWVSGRNTHATVFTNTYVKSFAHVKMMVKIATNDYPELKDDDIRVVVYSGKRRNGMMGIEFEVVRLMDEYFVMNSPEPSV